jgi:hypothetical protein
MTPTNQVAPTNRSQMFAAMAGTLVLIGSVVGCPAHTQIWAPIQPAVFCTIDGDCTTDAPPCAASVRCNAAANQCEAQSKCSSDQRCDNNQCCAQVVNQSCGKCGTGKYNCSGTCIEGSCPSPPPACIPTCDAGWVRGNAQSQPDPNGDYCNLRRSTPGGAIDLGNSTTGEALLLSQAPAECEARQQQCPAGIQGCPCAARAILGVLSNSCIPNDSGAVLFRCDGDASTETSLFLTDLKDTYPTSGDGPQFPCKSKLEIIRDKYTSKCRLQIEEVVWTGSYLACP